MAASRRLSGHYASKCVDRDRGAGPTRRLARLVPYEHWSGYSARSRFSHSSVVRRGLAVSRNRGAIAHVRWGRSAAPSCAGGTRREGCERPAWSPASRRSRRLAPGPFRRPAISGGCHAPTFGSCALRAARGGWLPLATAGRSRGAERDGNAVQRAVGRERYPCCPALDGCGVAINRRGRDRHAVAGGILDFDLVARLPVGQSELHLETRPGVGDAGCDAQRVAALERHAEHGLARHPEHPAGRTRVPGPPAAPDVRWDTVDVGGDDVRLHLIPVDGLPRACVVNGPDHLEQRRGAIAPAELGHRAHHPDSRVRVLPPVLADARAVAL